MWHITRMCRHLDEQTFTSLILALRWMVSIIETCCLREIFCPILSSTRITSHFSRMGPQRIGLAKLSNSWKSRRQTSFHQICGHPTGPIWTQSTTRSGAYCKNGFTRRSRNTAVLFSKNWLFCWVQCVLWLHFVTAIILRYTKNINKIYNCKPYRLKANFLTNTLM